VETDFVEHAANVHDAAKLFMGTAETGNFHEEIVACASAARNCRGQNLKFHASVAYFSCTSRSTRFLGISLSESPAVQTRPMASLMSFAGKFRFVRKSLCARRRRYWGCLEGICSTCSIS